MDTLIKFGVFVLLPCIVLLWQLYAPIFKEVR
jgi:hypothetical protein